MLGVVVNVVERQRCCAYGSVFVVHCRALSYHERSGLLDGAVGDEGGAGLGRGGIDLGNGSDTHGSGGESNSGSHCR
jgi:hypothetical protein